MYSSQQRLMNESWKVLFAILSIVFIWQYLELQPKIESLTIRPTAATTIQQPIKPAAPKIAPVPTKEQQYSAKLNPTLESENTAYNAAYKLVEDKNFSEAITAFKDFLWQYNNSKYIPNATYWLGELYLTEHKFDTAANYFLQVVNKYKDHAKAPDALLKLGMLEIERENWQEAKNYFMQIKNNYPNSSRVHMAEAKIQSLDREGH